MLIIELWKLHGKNSCWVYILKLEMFFMLIFLHDGMTFCANIDNFGSYLKWIKLAIFTWLPRYILQYNSAKDLFNW